MPINVNGFTLSGVNSTTAFNISNSTTSLLNIDTTGRTTTPNQIGFVAGYTGAAGWNARTTISTWIAFETFNTAGYNIGSGFNTSTNRFTAPVTGVYLMHGFSYWNKVSAAQGQYILVAFFINGGGSGCYKVRGEFQSAGYSFNGEVEDLIYLNAGDYIDYRFYATAVGMSDYPTYSMFSGFLVG